MTGPPILDALAAALAAVDQQARRLSALDAETAALRQELEETNRGLLALYAELSDRGQQLQEARAAAEQAARAKAEFLANVSHEVRSPISAIVGFTSLLDDTALTPAQADYVRTIRMASDHLLRVINDVLDLSKVESGGFELEDVEFDLYACVEDAVGIVAARAEEKGLAVAPFFERPPAGALRGDPGRIRQILVNLLGNAVKFAPRGEVTVTASTDPLGDGRARLTFAVRDTGIGIPAAAVDRLFAPFAQADASISREFGGTGLGLSICRQLSERMGGGITVESAEGAGSTFTCRIVVGAAPDGGEDTPMFAGRRAVVAHDQPVVAASVTQHLSRWGIAAAAPGPDPAAGVAFVDARHSAALEDVVPHGVPVVLLAPLSANRPALEALPGVRGVVTTPVRRRALAEVLGAVFHGPAHPDRPAPDEAPAGGLRILLVDDSAVIRRATSLLLGKRGHAVDEAADGRAAVEAAVAGDYDVVLMDLQMPGLDGLAATREIRRRRRGPGPRIFALTASVVDEAVHDWADAGMDGVLTKPLDVDALADALA